MWWRINPLTFDSVSGRLCQHNGFWSTRSLRRQVISSHAIHWLCTLWRLEMQTFSALLALCAGNSPITAEFSSQRPVTRSFDVFFNLRQNIRLNKQSRRRWFKTSSRSSWRHSNVWLNRPSSSIRTDSNYQLYHCVLKSWDIDICTFPQNSSVCTGLMHNLSSWCKQWHVTSTDDHILSMGSVNNANNSGGRKYTYIYDHNNWVQNIHRSK